MKHLNFYLREYNTDKSNDVLQEFINTLSPSNKTWSYFVDWQKVKANMESLEMEINILNCLIGKSDFDNKFRQVIKNYPKTIQALPMLIAYRIEANQELHIVQNDGLAFHKYSFNKTQISASDIEEYLDFVIQTGLKDFIINGGVKDLLGYVAGIEVGLDSNGRKNRSGKIMENMVEQHLKDVCSRKNIKYLKGRNIKAIEKIWGDIIPSKKKNPIHDFAVKNQQGRVFLVETNYYNGGGSKIKATASEYQKLNDTLVAENYSLIWITDGAGWLKAENSLKEAFENNEYIFNLNMVKKNILDEVF